MESYDGKFQASKQDIDGYMASRHEEMANMLDDIAKVTQQA